MQVQPITSSPPPAPIITFVSTDLNAFGEPKKYTAGSEGEIMTIAGTSVTAKCSLLAAILTGVSTDSPIDMGFEVSVLKRGEVVVYIDAETSTTDSAGFDATEKIHYYNIFGFSWQERQAFLEYLPGDLAAKSLRVKIIIVDSNPAIVAGTREDDEQYYRLLVAVAQKYRCLVVPVVHISDKSEGSAPIGTVGSYLQRKSASMFEVGFKDGAYFVIATKLRNAARDGFPKISFKWDEVLGMPVSCSGSELPTFADREFSVRCIVAAIISPGQEMPAGDFADAVMQHLQCGRTKANDVIRDAKELRILLKVGQNLKHSTNDNDNEPPF